MDKLQAIEWLYEAELDNISEWVEAGMWNAVQDIMACPRDTIFNEEDLKEMKTKAENN